MSIVVCEGRISFPRIFTASFSLKDIDGGEPTGDYVIDDIRVDTRYHYSCVSGQKVYTSRVYVGCESRYTRVCNVVRKDV